MTDGSSPLRVLLLEDSDDDAELLMRALRDGGLSFEAYVVTSESGFRAALAAFSPSLTLADWALPGFSGGAALAIAREWDSNVPCILVSGALGEELVVEALRSGATDYVIKQRLAPLVPAVKRAIAEAAEHRARLVAEAAASTSRAAMQGSLDAMADPFVVCAAIRNADGAIADFVVLFANRAAGAFMGGEAFKLVGHRLRASMGSLGTGWLFDVCREVVETGEEWSTDGIVLAPPLESPPVDGMRLDIRISKYEDGFYLLIRDVSERLRLERERDRLAAIVEGSSDGIVIADAEGRVTYANAAFRAGFGLHPRDAVRAPGPEAMLGGLEAGAIAEIDQTIKSGRGWLGEVDQRHPDGTVSHVEISVTPGPWGSHGAASTYVGVFRDVTSLREAEDELALEAGIRLALAEGLHAIPEEATVEHAAKVICDALVTLRFIDVALVEVFLGDVDVKVIALAAPRGFPLAAGDSLTPACAAMVRERSLAGPWAAGQTCDPVEAGLDPAFPLSRRPTLAYGPIAHLDQVVGCLAIGTYDERFARLLHDRTSRIVSFSTTSSALLAGRMHVLCREAEMLGSLAAMLMARSFRPVFQPIVDLESGEVVGYEALTRFASGQRPDLCFKDAWLVGLGPLLEIATLEAAIAASSALPPGRWLNLNASPRLLAEAGGLRDILSSARRPIVLEITEHDMIDDYGAVREAVRALGSDVRLAVDDAGAGIANFGHIIELRPDLVKLDIGVVHGVNTNLGRQAMVIGMSHFSRTAGCRLIAEGIETEEEARTLTSLGVEYGQGYLFGHPEPVDTWAGVMSERRDGPPGTALPPARTRASERQEAASQPAPRKARGAQSEGPGRDLDERRRGTIVRRRA